MIDAAGAILLISAEPILERLDRMEKRFEAATPPKLVRAKAAIALFGGTKAQFYALVEKGEIEQIRYEDNAESLYDVVNIRAVIEKHRVRRGSRR